MSNSYAELLAHAKTTTALGQVAGLLSWDQETMMPKGSGHQRAAHQAALSEVLHARRTDPAVGDWLSALEASDLDATQKGMVAQIRRDYDRNTKVPADLAIRLAELTSRAQAIWAQARADEDVAAFLPTLAEIITLKRHEADALAAGGDAYDAMLQDYEPGQSAAGIDALFDPLRDGLVDLRTRIKESGQDPKPLQGRFSRDQQILIARELAEAFTYDWDRGRLDFAVHPFSSGSFNDVRITTRVAEEDPFNCFYSTIHEVGHAVYEQNVNADYGLTPIGNGASMGVHESQSRIFENQLGRSRAFCGYVFGRMTDVFGDIGLPDADAFYAAVNRVGQGYIRTEADEVQYNLHIMLRFALERDLIAGRLGINDLEAAWNDRFARDFGYEVDKPSNGMLQDVHWSVGLFGYFPTYALGNLYAGCLYEKLRVAVPSLDEDLAHGKAGSAVAWLTETIHQHGAVMLPAEIMQQALGHAPTPQPLLTYLNAKFGAIYGL